jgi:hypothetical protein
MGLVDTYGRAQFEFGRQGDPTASANASRMVTPSSRHLQIGARESVTVDFACYTRGSAERRINLRPIDARRHARLVIVSLDSRAQRVHCQAETPPIVLC